MIKIVTRGIEKRTDKLLKAFGTQGLRKVGNKARDLVNLSISDAFDEARDPITHKKWKPRKKRYRHRPLQKSLDLRKGTKALYRLNGTKLGIYVDIKGPAKKYGWAHQFGHQYATHYLPARRFIGFQAKYRKQLLRAMDSMLK